jgi:hypothetical protein
MDEAWLVALVAYLLNVTVLFAVVRFAKRDPSKHQSEIRGMNDESQSSSKVEPETRCQDDERPDGHTLFRCSQAICKYLARRRPRIVLTAVAVTVGVIVISGVVARGVGALVRRCSRGPAERR